MVEPRFSFSNTADAFDDHIGQSIRGYHDLRDDIVSMSKYFVEDHTSVVDIGCSQGTMIRRIRDANDQAPDASYIGVHMWAKWTTSWGLINM